MRRIRIHNMQLLHAVECFSPPRIHVGDGWQVQYHARLLAIGKRGDDTHGELTDMACYVLPTREPQGLGSGWGPARFARNAGQKRRGMR